MAISLSDPVAAFSCLMSLMAWDWGFTQEMGSVCRASFPSTAMPDSKMTTLTMARGTAVRCGQAAEEHRHPAEAALAEVLALGRRLVLADAEDRQGGDDAAHAHGDDPDDEQGAELADGGRLGEPQRHEGEDGVEGDDEQRRPEAACGGLDGVGGAVEDHLLFDARVHLDGVVHAHAEQDRERGDGGQGERDVEVADEAEPPHEAERPRWRRRAVASAP